MFMEAMIPHCSQWKDVHLTLPLSAVRRYHPRCSVASLRQPIPPRVDLPFAQLTTLRIGNTGTDHTIAILQRCPSLLDLSCSYTRAGSQSISYLPVELRFLRSLTAADKHILAFLTDIDADALESLISRSLCDLRFLCVQVYQTDGAAHSKSLLRFTTSVAHLKLEGEGIESQMQVFQNADVLPRLKYLEICDSVGILPGLIHDYRLLTNLLRMRQEHGILQSFELSLGPIAPVPPAHAMTAFHAVAAAGLQVRVTQDEAVLLDTRTT
ncbi:hypothetical protein DFH08DRAFT_1011103 [Mycena albidolilacea]|uniref:F-box domain-containing protein n=1 Tax=Mycena albidolilacea TaxID=1033008 RepID=A0AAD6ZW16_9AGAR|nr:hypothetical protein DFH08DRAFT_1011103 [Mycena albidolilacea]